MKLGATVFLLLAMTGIAGGEEQLPVPADFIPPEAQIYFRTADGLRYWGAESSGWRFALLPDEPKLTFLDGGGHAEEIRLYLTVFVQDPDWHHWAKQKSLRVAIKMVAEGLPDMVQTATMKSDSFSGNAYGSCWGIPVSVSLHDLFQHWGRLPAKVAITAMLTQDGLPTPSTSAATVALTPVAPDQASWGQRVNSLRPGQTRQEVEALLGKPESEETEQGDGRTILLYRNPHPAEDLPEILRITRVVLDAEGHYLGVKGGC